MMQCDESGNDSKNNASVQHPLQKGNECVNCPNRNKSGDNLVHQQSEDGKCPACEWEINQPCTEIQTNGAKCPGIIGEDNKVCSVCKTNTNISGI